ncbi:hypothetical protein JOQ06_013610, partial [Pogonophryne albipinna]
CVATAPGLSRCRWWMAELLRLFLFGSGSPMAAVGSVSECWQPATPSAYSTPTKISQLKIVT